MQLITLLSLVACALARSTPTRNQPRALTISTQYPTATLNVNGASKVPDPQIGVTVFYSPAANGVPIDVQTTYAYSVGTPADSSTCLGGPGIPTDGARSMLVRAFPD